MPESQLLELPCGTRDTTADIISNSNNSVESVRKCPFSRVHCWKGYADSSFIHFQCVFFSGADSISWGYHLICSSPLTLQGLHLPAAYLKGKVTREPPSSLLQTQSPRPWEKCSYHRKAQRTHKSRECVVVIMQSILVIGLVLWEMIWAWFWEHVPGHGCTRNAYTRKNKKFSNFSRRPWRSDICFWQPFIYWHVLSADMLPCFRSRHHILIKVPLLIKISVFPPICLASNI